MATVTLRGNPSQTNGDLPEIGTSVPPFTLTGSDLSEFSADSLAGKKVVLNIFPSVDTGTCAASVRTFNARAAEAEGAVVLCVSQDLPFAQGRFCGAEGIENVTVGSGFRSDFAEQFGVKLENGPLAGLMARAVVVVDESGEVVHTQLVGEIADEPDYDAALAALT